MCDTQNKLHIIFLFLYYGTWPYNVQDFDDTVSTDMSNIYMSNQS
jgi:hypothetical protein